MDVSVPKPASLTSLRRTPSRLVQCRPLHGLYWFAPTNANSNAFWAGVSWGIRSTCPNMDHHCWAIRTESGTVLHILYRALFDIMLSGQRCWVMVRRCLR
jgi:hypothetical protein